MLHIPGVSFGTTDTVDTENLLPAPVQAALISQPLLPVPTASETLVSASNQNSVLGTFDDLDDSLSDAHLSSSLVDSKTAAP